MKYDKLIDKWLTATPESESKDVVEKVLVHYFGDDFFKRKTSSSHQYRIKDSRLAELTQFGPYGYLSIPISGGQKVIKVYLKQIALAVKHIESQEGFKNE